MEEREDEDHSEGIHGTFDPRQKEDSERQPSPSIESKNKELEDGKSKPSPSSHPISLNNSHSSEEPSPSNFLSSLSHHQPRESSPRHCETKLYRDNSNGGHQGRQEEEGGRRGGEADEFHELKNRIMVAEKKRRSSSPEKLLSSAVQSIHPLHSVHHPNQQTKTPSQKLPHHQNFRKKHSLKASPGPGTSSSTCDTGSRTNESKCVTSRKVSLPSFHELPSFVHFPSNEIPSGYSEQHFPRQVVSSFPAGRRRTIHEFILLEPSSSTTHLEPRRNMSSTSCTSFSLQGQSNGTKFQPNRNHIQNHHHCHKLASSSSNSSISHPTSNKSFTSGQRIAEHRKTGRSLSLSPELLQFQALQTHNRNYGSNLRPSSSRPIDLSVSNCDLHSKQSSRGQMVSSDVVTGKRMGNHHQPESTSSIQSLSLFTESINSNAMNRGHQDGEKELKTKKKKKIGKWSSSQDAQACKRREFTKELLTCLGSIIYALVLIVAALFFYLLDIMDKTEGSHSSFNSVLCIIGISWLSFLYFDLQKYKNRIMKKMFSSGLKDLDHDKNDHNRTDGGLYLTPYEMGNDSDRMSATTEVICNNMYRNPLFCPEMNDLYEDEVSYVGNGDFVVPSSGSVINFTAKCSSDPKAVPCSSITSGIEMLTSGSIHSMQSSDTEGDASFTGWSSPEPSSKQQQQEKSRRESSLTAVTDESRRFFPADHSESNDELHIEHHYLDRDCNFNECSECHYADEKDKNIEEMTGGRMGEEDTWSTENKVTCSASSSYRFLGGRSSGSFYLKCGMAAFCFGHIIHEGLIFGHQVFYYVTGDESCQSLPTLVHHTIRPIFSFYQLFICFKYSNIVINRHEVLASFGVMHLFGTSIAFWIGTIIDDAVDFYTQHHLNDGSSFLSNSDHGVNTSLYSDLLPNNLSHNTINEHYSSPQSVPGSAVITLECIQSVSPSISSSKIFPYMYPFTIEYNVCLAVLWYLIWHQIGSDTKSSKIHSLKETTKKDALGANDERFKELSNRQNIPKSNVHANEGNNNGNRPNNETSNYESTLTIRADCHASNKGLFAGLFILMFSLVTMIMFFISLGSSSSTTSTYGVVDVTIINPGLNHNININTSTDLPTSISSIESTSNGPLVGISMYIFHIQETLLTVLIFVSTCVAYYHTSKFDVVHTTIASHTMDYILLVVPLFFYFVNNILGIAAECSYRNWPRVILLIFITIQVIFQTVFIIDAMHRCSSESWSVENRDARNRFKKPGREFITFSILLNITSWIVYTFESKAVEPFLNEVNFYGENFWMIVSHTTLPLMLFYRFHCSVCLADIWKFAYEKSHSD